MMGMMSGVSIGGGGGGAGGGMSFGFGMGGSRYNVAGNVAGTFDFLAGAVKARALDNATTTLKYGTKAISAAELTVNHVDQMTNLAKNAGSIGTKLGVAGLVFTVLEDTANGNFGWGTGVKAGIGIASVLCPGFGLAMGFADVMFLARVH